MNLPDKHLTLLHDIESPIIDLYRNYPNLKDNQVRKVLGELIKKYRALATQRKVLEPVYSSEIEQVLYKNIATNLERKRSSTGVPASEKPKSLFGRKNKEASADEIFLACLRRVEKSVDRWNKRGGEQGYLNFVQGYV